jgi:cystathionine gamma-lyase
MDYIRASNGTRNAFELNLAACENAKYGLAFSSGCAATTTIVNMMTTGDHIVSIDDVYGGTHRMFSKIATNFGIDTTFHAMEDMKSLEKAITKKTKILWVETPTNPTLKVVDLKAISKVAKKKGVLMLVDNTFLSPFNQKPID